MTFEAFSVRRLSAHQKCLRYSGEPCIATTSRVECLKCYEAYQRKMTLKRITDIVAGTFGVLLDGEVPFAVTLERRWLKNRTDLSCIPAGEYLCQHIDSPRFGDTFEVMHVKDRTDILFHKGNQAEDTRGCILVAEEFGELADRAAVLDSHKGFGEFLERLAGVNEFWLEIKNV